MEQLLEQLLNETAINTTATSLSEVVIKMFLTFSLGLLVAMVYKHVHKGISYSASYAYSIVIVAMVVAFVMMVIGSNVTRAFTLLGAFTLIRYRTAVKDPKDTAFIFLALVVGLGVGASEYIISIAGVSIIAFIAIVLDKINFGAAIRADQILYLSVDSKKLNQQKLETVLKSLCKTVTLISVNYDSDTHTLEYSYKVSFSKRYPQTQTSTRLAEIEGVNKLEILSSQQVIEF